MRTQQNILNIWFFVVFLVGLLNRDFDEIFGVEYIKKRT